MPGGKVIQSPLDSETLSHRLPWRPTWQRFNRYHRFVSPHHGSPRFLPTDLMMNRVTKL